MWCAFQNKTIKTKIQPKQQHKSILKTNKIGIQGIQTHKIESDLTGEGKSGLKKKSLQDV